MMKINNEFNIGDIVYFKTDVEQLPRIVTQITICGNGSILYGCSYSELQSSHYAIELSKEKDIVLSTSN
jgi:hypothetical protein